MIDQDLLPIIDKYAKRRGLRPDLVRKVIEAESSGRPDAVSPKKAVGLMQLEPETAADYGQYDLTDPEQNIDVGTRHLSRLMNKYGDERTALAAYNAGEGRVDSGRPLPKETTAYQTKILGEEKAPEASTESQNPAEEKVAEPAPAKGETVQGVTLDRVTSDPDFAKFSPDQQARIVHSLLGEDKARLFALSQPDSTKIGAAPRPLEEHRTAAEAFDRLMEHSGISGVMEKLLGKVPGGREAELDQTPLTEADAAGVVRGLGETAATALTPFMGGISPANLAKMLGLATLGASAGKTAGRALGEKVGLPQTGEALGEVLGGFGAGGVAAGHEPAALGPEQDVIMPAGQAIRRTMGQPSLNVREDLSQGAQRVIQFLSNSLARERMALANRGAVRGRFPVAETPPEMGSDRRTVKTPQEVAAGGSVPLTAEAHPGSTGVEPSVGTGPGTEKPAVGANLPADEQASQDFLTRLRASIVAQREAAREAGTLKQPEQQPVPQAPVQQEKTSPAVGASAEVPVNKQVEAPPQAAAPSQETSGRTARISGQNYQTGEVVETGPHAGKTVLEVSEEGIPVLSKAKVAASAGQEEGVAPEPAPAYVSKEAPAGSEPAAAAPAQERRSDVAMRKRVEEMSDEEKAAEINRLRASVLTNDVTGLPNRRAYDEAQRMPVQMKFDVDNLKGVNDHLGEENGTQLLKTVAQAMREQGEASGLPVYHFQGDEFAGEATDKQQAQDFYDALSERLAQSKLVAVLPDGSKQEFPGIKLHFGMGEDYGKADTALMAAKNAAKAAGTAAERGSAPAGLRTPGAAARPAGPDVVLEKPATGDEAPPASRAPAPAEGRADQAPPVPPRVVHTDLGEPTVGQEVMSDYGKGRVVQVTPEFAFVSWPPGPNRMAFKQGIPRSKFWEKVRPVEVAGEATGTEGGGAAAAPKGQGGPRYSVQPNALGFYSQLDRVLEDPKTPANQTGQQWLGFLTDQKRAVKAAELEWTGLRDILEADPKKHYTKDELQNLAQPVQIKEVTFGGKPRVTPEMSALATEMERSQQKYREAKIILADKLIAGGMEPDRASRLARQVDYPYSYEDGDLEDLSEALGLEKPTVEGLKAAGWTVSVEHDTSGHGGHDYYDVLNPEGRTADSFEMLARKPLTDDEVLSRHISYMMENPEDLLIRASEVRDVFDAKSALRDAADKYEAVSKAANAPARYDRPNLKLPGEHSNYREVLLTIPQKKLPAPKKEDLYFVRPGEDGFDVVEKTTGLVARRGLATRGLAEQTAARYADISYIEGQLEPELFSSGHYSNHSNVIGWFRLTDRSTPDGKKVMQVEEIQSDWAQKGHKEGFKRQVPQQELDEANSRLGRAQAAYEEAAWKYNLAEDDLADRETQNDLYGAMEKADNERYLAEEALSQLTNQYDKINRGPFVENTEDVLTLALKRILRLAAEEGYDKVAWTTGQQQIDRYDLGHHISEIVWTRTPEGDYDVIGYDRGTSVFSRTLTSKQLVDNLGAGMAEKIKTGEGADLFTVETPDKSDIRSNIESREVAQKYADEHGGKVVPLTGKFKGVDLQVGGKMHQLYYDKKIPSILIKLGKKWGVKVEQTNISDSPRTISPEGDLLDGVQVFSSSAEPFADGNKPVIARGYVRVTGRARTPATVIADREGIQLTFPTLDGNDEEVYHLNRPLATQQEAVQAIKNLWWDYNSAEWAEFKHMTPNEGDRLAQMVHSIDISPSMREGVLKEGFPQYQTGRGELSQVTTEALRRNLPPDLAQKMATLPDGDHVIMTPRGNIVIRPTGEIDLDWHALEAGHGEEVAAGVRSGLRRVVASTETVNGDQLIQLVEAGALPHEIGHAFLDHFATPRERDAIVRSLQRVADAEGRSVDEVFADGFQDWFTHDRDSRQNENLIQQMFRRIYEFFYGVYHTIHPTLEGAYREVASGRAFERAPEGAEPGPDQRYIGGYPNVTPEEDARMIASMEKSVGRKLTQEEKDTMFGRPNNLVEGAFPADQKFDSRGYPRGAVSEPKKYQVSEPESPENDVRQRINRLLGITKEQPYGTPEQGRAGAEVRSEEVRQPGRDAGGPGEGGQQEDASSEAAPDFASGVIRKEFILDPTGHYLHSPDYIREDIENKAKTLEKDCGGPYCSDLRRMANFVKRVATMHFDSIVKAIDSAKQVNRAAVKVHGGDEEQGIPTLWALGWEPGENTDIHDHKNSLAAVHVLRGAVGETIFEAPKDYVSKAQDTKGFETKEGTHVLLQGGVQHVKAPYIHIISGLLPGRSVTLHAYYPPLNAMNYFRREGDKLVWDGEWDETKPPEIGPPKPRR